MSVHELIPIPVKHLALCSTECLAHKYLSGSVKEGHLNEGHLPRKLVLLPPTVYVHLSRLLREKYAQIRSQECQHCPNQNFFFGNNFVGLEQ